MKDNIYSASLDEKISEFEQIAISQKKNFEESEKLKRKLYRNIIRESPGSREQLLRVFSEHCSATNVPGEVVAYSKKINGLKNIASFRALISLRTRKNELDKSSAFEWYLNNKIKAYDFIDILNISRPKIFDQIYSIDNLPDLSGVAIKPVNGSGSKGVYLVYAEDFIIEAQSSDKITCKLDMRRRMSNLIRTGSVSADKWIVEELIFGDSEEKSISSDLKFYCFYGKMPLILNVSRYPKTVSSWWTMDGEQVQALKNNLLVKDVSFSDLGINESVLKLVSELSLEIPAPFMRIDS